MGKYSGKSRVTSGRVRKEAKPVARPEQDVGEIQAPTSIVLNGSEAFFAGDSHNPR